MITFLFYILCTIFTYLFQLFSLLFYLIMDFLFILFAFFTKIRKKNIISRHFCTGKSGL